MDYTNLLEQADLFLVHSYRKNHNPQLYFHTIERVRDIVNAVMTLSEKYALTAEDKFVLKCVAYFQDIGYLFEGVKGTREKSISVARCFLQEHFVAESVIEKIEMCILATRPSKKPENLLEEIVADAVSFHLGSKSFVDLNQRMYLEVNYRRNQVIDERIWYALTLVFLRNHTYFTEEARLLKEGIKKNNIVYFVTLQTAGKQSSV
ncbi:hypothetical protein [Sphingobacterium multivorum]|uniref:hypothetical protein n=2 Tax=Sphingobacterium multivorum TaxID=28454 RepID=UPI000ECFDDAC|nr:hypothetical protein [Sphingobacterium multivorum]HCX55297.1 hypothetical protein [Sphingobacterium sp.]